LIWINHSLNQNHDHGAFSRESNVNGPSGPNAHGFLTAPSIQILMIDQA